MSLRPSVLFISHSAGRTGAPILLLHFLRWFKVHTTIPFQILLKEGGPLIQEFRSLAPTTIYPELSRSVPRNLFQRLLRKAGLAYQVDYQFNPLTAIYKPGDINLIYSNTITNGKLLEALSYLNCPVVSHVHELSCAIQYLGQKNLDQVKTHTTHFIACAEVVRRNLVTACGIPSDQISVVHEFIHHDSNAQPSTVAQGIRSLLSIPPEAFVVGGAGAGFWRKGKDLFIHLAMLIARQHPKRTFRFIWVGQLESDEDQSRIDYDMRQSGLAGQVQFVGEVSNPLDYFESMDAFVLTSREDPFPLVCLEAALSGKPIICFDQAGGMPEFVEDDAGFVVPYLDVGAMAEKILLLSNSTELAQRLGQCAARKVRDRHTTAVAAPQIKQIITNVAHKR